MSDSKNEDNKIQGEEAPTKNCPSAGNEKSSEIDQKGVANLADIIGRLSREIQEHHTKFVWMDDVKFPIEINGINMKQATMSRGKLSPGRLVAVRPCSKNPDNKTFLGLYLGELMVDFMWEYEKDTKVVHLLPHYNPAILIPEQNRVVWGMDSWWSEIESADKLRQITNKVIQDTWYVKLLQEQLEIKKNELQGETPSQQE